MKLAIVKRLSAFLTGEFVADSQFRISFVLDGFIICRKNNGAVARKATISDCTFSQEKLYIFNLNHHKDHDTFMMAKNEHHMLDSKRPYMTAFPGNRKRRLGTKR